MELNINSPAYYTNQYGVIDEIYAMCREISDYVKAKSYGTLINTVGIIPIVAPNNIIEQGLFKEEKKCEVKYGFASVSIQINYEEFLQSDINGKKKLIINNILNSVKSIHKKAKIDYVEFNNDIMRFCQQADITI